MYGLHVDWIHDFLVDRKKIQPGQSVSDVSEAYATDALARITEFRAAIVKFGQAKETIPMNEPEESHDLEQGQLAADP